MGERGRARESCIRSPVRHLPVVLAVACTAGVAFGALATGDIGGAALLAGALAWVGALAAWTTRRAPAVLMCGVTALAGWGAALGNEAVSRALEPPLVRLLATGGGLPDDGSRPDTTVRLEGRLIGDAVAAARTTNLRLRVARVWPDPMGGAQPAPGEVWLSVAGEAAAEARSAWRAGRVVAVEATLRRPTAYRNPGAPDARRQAARRRLALIGSVKSAHLVEVLAPGRWWEEAGAALRAHARGALARAAAGADDAASVGAAVLIGDRAGLSPELEDRLQRAGTFHVIAISGGNIALWALMATWAAARVSRRRDVTFVVLALALVGYAGLVGGGASVLRATGMALVGAATRWLDQRAAAVNVLACTGGVLVVADPLLVLDVGFWLTTAATAGLVLGLPTPEATGSRLRSLMRALFLTSWAAEVALLPIVTLVFQQVTLAGILVSALAIPSMAFVQMSALAVVLADVVSPSLAGLPGRVLQWSTLGVTGSARLVDVWPWLAWKVPPPSWPVVMAYYAALCGAVAAGHLDSTAGGRATRIAAMTAATLGLWIAVSPLTLVRARPGHLSITAFDVGQGDATLLVFPSGHGMLVDAGGVMGDGRDFGARVLGPALRRLGLRRLDTLVVTHPDLDHVGGAATLVREFEPREVWIGIPVADHAPSRALREAADQTGAAWREVRRGERVTLGGVEVRILHPEPPDWERQRVRNDDSVVMDVRFSEARVVLAGDIGRDLEAALVGQGLAAHDGGSGLTVLKVAHHGSPSGTSEPWLDALRPRVAIVSAGAANPFGHPAPAVLTRLAAVGAAVWRTDRDGAVTVRTDGHVLEVVAASGRRAVLRPRRRRKRSRPAEWPPLVWRRPRARSARRGSAGRAGCRPWPTASPCA